jgi:hypothetical protein
LVAWRPWRRRPRIDNKRWLSSEKIEPKKRFAKDYSSARSAGRAVILILKIPMSTLFGKKAGDWSTTPARMLLRLMLDHLTRIMQPMLADVA